VVAPLKQVRGYVVTKDSPKELRMIENAKLAGVLKENPRVYVVNGKELIIARAQDLKEGSVVLILPK
jgi:hypothetical protein